VCIKCDGPKEPDPHDAVLVREAVEGLHEGLEDEQRVSDLRRGEGLELLEAYTNDE